MSAAFALEEVSIGQPIGYQPRFGPPLVNRPHLFHARLRFRLARLERALAAPIDDRGPDQIAHVVIAAIDTRAEGVEIVGGRCGRNYGTGAISCPVLVPA